MCMQIKDLQRSVVDVYANKGLSSKNTSLANSSFTHFQSLTAHPYKNQSADRSLQNVHTALQINHTHTQPIKPRPHLAPFIVPV
jgi:hypothetical protein